MIHPKLLFMYASQHLAGLQKRAVPGWGGRTAKPGGGPAGGGRGASAPPVNHTSEPVSQLARSRIRLITKHGKALAGRQQVLRSRHQLLESASEFQ